MSVDRVQQAIEAGEKNLRTWKLVENWCANVKIVKFGGTGIVEMQTGLPIGHHFLECPHAPAGGMAAWDLADTAIDFYDRNCVGCKFRKPVGLPNISGLVAERDSRRRDREQEQASEARAVADRLTTREASRQVIRQNLGALSAATLDHISELDRTRSDTAAIGLVGLAELASETFTPEIVEHLFALAISDEYWLLEPCLEALEKLSADPSRLCKAALRSLAAHNACDVAAHVVEKHTEHADDPGLIEAALPALIGLASPIPLHFGLGDHRPRQPVLEPLSALYGAHRIAVRAALKAILDRKDAYDIRIAARGLDVLAEIDPSLLDFLPLQLTSKLVRAGHLVQGREEDVTGALDDIRSVLTKAFLKNPREVDSIFDQYLVGARAENAAELYKVFDVVLREIKFDHQTPKAPKVTEAHRVAFRRLVVAATNARGFEQENVTSSVFSGDPYKLTPLVEEKIDLLLGSAAVLSTKLDEHESSAPKRASEMVWMERLSRRSYLDNLLNCFVRWSCIAAGGAGVTSVQRVLNFLRALPEDNTALRGAIIHCFSYLMCSVDTLALCLPDYYSSLVGPQQLIRSEAATALGDSPFVIICRRLSSRHFVHLSPILLSLCTKLP